MNRNGIIRTIPLLSLLVLACASGVPPAGAPGPDDEDVCSSGNKSKNKPVICVDDMGMPEPQKKPSWDYESNGNGNPTTTHVTVTWYAKDSTADLVVKFENSECVKPSDVKCKPNRGECTAKIRTIDWDKVEPGKERAYKSLTCRYKTTLTINGKTIDPDGDLIVNPCCW